MRKSKNLPIYILLIFLLISITYGYREPLGNAKEFFGYRFFPCSQTMTYSIGTLDPRFNLSKEQLIEKLANASKFWNDAQAKILFEYNPTGGALTINLIYDHRQEATEKLKKLGINIDENENAYYSLKTRYDSLSIEYTKQRDALDAMIRDYNQQRASYDSSVAYWNNRGGAPKNEFAKLENQRKALSVEANKIEDAQVAINQTVDTLNALATTLNKLISDLNLKVSNYNNIGASAGIEFQEGVYKSSFNQQQIDIYQFEDEVKLLRVLAHEFGHTLGIEHVDDPKAIMYRVNQGETAMLTEADIEALNDICSSGLRFINVNQVTP